jgi:hypothetical protein
LVRRLTRAHSHTLVEASSHPRTPGGTGGRCQHRGAVQAAGARFLPPRGDAVEDWLERRDDRHRGQPGAATPERAVHLSSHLGVALVAHATSPCSRSSLAALDDPAHHDGERAGAYAPESSDVRAVAALPWLPDLPTWFCCRPSRSRPGRLKRLDLDSRAPAGATSSATRHRRRAPGRRSHENRTTERSVDGQDTDDADCRRARRVHASSSWTRSSPTGSRRTVPGAPRRRASRELPGRSAHSRRARRAARPARAPARLRSGGVERAAVIVLTGQLGAGRAARLPGGCDDRPSATLPWFLCRGESPACAGRPGD